MYNLNRDRQNRVTVYAYLLLLLFVDIQSGWYSRCDHATLVLAKCMSFLQTVQTASWTRHASMSSEALSPGVQLLRREADHSRHLVPRVGTGAIPPLLAMPQWPPQGQLYLLGLFDLKR